LTEPEELKRVYANVMAAHRGPYDLTLDFGHRLDEGDPNFEVRISMSWEHAVSMLVVLQKMLEEYEAQGRRRAFRRERIRR